MADRRPRPYGRSLWSTSWGAQLREQLAVVGGLPTEMPSVHLTAFDRLDRRLAQRDLTRDEVLDDIRDGIFNVSPIEDRNRDGRNRRAYRMITRRLELRLHVEASRPSSNGYSGYSSYSGYGSTDRPADVSVPLAVLDNAFPRRREARSDLETPLLPADVTLSAPRDRVAYDLDDLVELIRKRRSLAEAERTLTQVKLTPRRHAELRAEVRRQYGSLRALLTLAQQRADVGDKLSCPGTVIRGAEAFPASHPLADELVVRLDAVVPFSREEGGRLAIWREGESARRPPTLALGDAVDDVVALMLPDGAERAERVRRRFAPGQRVVVSETGEFRYGRHLYALRKFLDDEEVVGNWTSLATLLCQPGNLAAPEHLDEITPDRRPLNAAQRRAVAGALASSHGYFVKGPPGTGKTQVITEIVSRLAARGERVLLAAPTHVAVDEVLRRLKDEPGVLPLRLSFKDSLVADDVRRFTKSGYSGMLAQDVRTPATSRLPEWEARLEQLNGERAALTAWHAVLADRASGEAALASARQARDDGDRQRAGERARLTAHLEKARAIVEAWAAELRRLEGEDRSLTARIAAAEPTRGRFGRFLDRIGLGELGRLAAAQRRLQERRVSAEASYRQAGHHLATTSQHHDQAMAAVAERERHELALVSDLERRLAEIAVKVDAAHQGVRQVGLAHLADDQAQSGAHLVGLDSEASELAALVQVQGRWFELIGMTGDENGDRERSSTVVGRALTSAVNLICSTTTGFGGAPDHRDLDYDTLIVDEASKVTGAEFLIAARRARRWILVGDEKQLPPYVEPADEHHLHALAAIHLTEREGATLEQAVERLAGIWEHLEDTELHAFRRQNVEEIAKRLLANGTWASAHRKLYADEMRHVKGSGTSPEHQLLVAMHKHLVDSLFHRCVTAAGGGLLCRLEEQRRMPAEIAELVRVPVYEGAYRSPESGEDETAPQPLTTPEFPTPVVLFDTSAQPAVCEDWGTGTSVVNELEALWVAEVCRLWENELPKVGVSQRTSISVLSFYGAQTRLIRQQLGHPHYRGFDLLDFQVVDSIDRIQGQESDLVVLSFCRTSNTRPDTPLKEGYARWLQSINRLNVACTRARRSLVLVGHRPTLQRLNGVTAAERFYLNLFAQNRDTLTIRSDWAPEGRRPQNRRPQNRRRRR
jgi:hypothetical protein